MRRFVGLAVLLVLGVGAGLALAGSSSTGTVAVCASASVGEQTIAVNAQPVVTVPAAADDECAATTYTVPTETETATVTTAETTTETQTFTTTETAPPVTVTETTTVTTPAPAPLPAANAWIGNVGLCVPSVTPLPYNPATACSSPSAAVAALPASGGSVLAKCGTYVGSFGFSTVGKTGMTTIASESGRCATFDSGTGGPVFTFASGASFITLDSLTIRGLVKGTTTTGLGNNNIVVSRDDINVAQKVNGPSITFSVGDHIAVVGVTIGPTCCGFNGGKGASPEGIRIGKPSSAVASCTTQVCHLLISDNVIQGVVRDCALYPASFGACPDTSCPNTVGCHADGIHIWGVDGALITRNTLTGDECQGVFLENTNASLNRDVAITLNTIGALPGGCSNKGIYISASGTTDGATNGFAGAWTIADNTGASQLIAGNGCGSCWPSMTVTLSNNDMIFFGTSATGNNAGCLASWGKATPTYTSNRWRAGGSNVVCGPTDVIH